MTSNQEQKLSKCLLLQGFFSQNPHVLEIYSHLRPVYDLFNQRLSLILKIEQMSDECGSYLVLREELVKSTVTFCRKITSFALLEEISELQGMFFSQLEVQAMSELELINIGQLLLDKTVDHRNDLIEYGIDDDFLRAFRDLMDKVKTVAHQHDVLEELTDRTLNEFSVFIQESEEIMTNHPGHLVTHTLKQ